MTFEIVHIIDKMEALYRIPRSKERFDIYLNMLQGGSGSDMILPIAGYNPMGNDFVLEKLIDLKKLDVENLISEELISLNRTLKSQDSTTFQVVINLIDDVGGAWSEHCTTDYNSRFKLTPLLRRKFSTPIFWTSENFNKNLIVERTRRQVYDTVYNCKFGPPLTLKDHVQQELFVQNESININDVNELQDFEKLNRFYQKHLESKDYSLIFNFLYGDEASESLGYNNWGHKENACFSYAIMLSIMQNEKMS